MSGIDSRCHVDRQCPAGFGQLVEMRFPLRCFVVAQQAHAIERIVQFFGIAHLGHASARTWAIASGSSRPRSLADSNDKPRRSVTARARRSSNGAIEKRIRIGIENFVAERRRLTCVAGDQFHLAGAISANSEIQRSTSIASCRQS